MVSHLESMPYTRTVRILIFEYISGYVDADEPTIDELGDPPYSSEDIADYEKLLADFKTNKKSLAYTKHKLMTLDELLALLEKQDRIF